MRDPRIEKHVALNLEPVTAVEAERLHLRVEQSGFEPLFARRAQHRCQQRTTNTLATPLPQHGDASDVPVAQQARSADGDTVQRPCQCMSGVRIRVVPLELFRDLLLDDEHRTAYRLQRSARLVPRDEPDLEAGRRSRHGRRL